MSKFCPELNRNVLYMECLECDSKVCNSRPGNVQKSIYNKHKHLKENPSVFNLVSYNACDFAEKESYNSLKKDLCKDKEYLDSLFEDRNYNKLENELAERMSKLSYMITKANHDENKAVIIGQYAEYLLSARNRLTRENMVENFINYINSCSTSKIIIICKIIIKAAQENYTPDEMSQDNLLEAEKFEIINALYDLGVITFVTPGPYRYLYLTEFGKESYRKNKIIVDFLGS